MLDAVAAIALAKVAVEELGEGAVAVLDRRDVRNELYNFRVVGDLWASPRVPYHRACYIRPETGAPRDWRSL